jgi:acetoacetyl-CoA synthetase
VTTHVEPLWRPSPQRIAAARLTEFARFAQARAGRALGDYAGLHAWSVADRPAFWQAVWDYAGLRAHTPARAVVEDAERMPGSRWFPGATLNYAEHLLRYADDRPALVWRNERRERRVLTYADLHREAGAVAAVLRAWDVAPGDRVCGVMPNIPEAIVAMLAAASIGAVWSSCSPEFGVQAVLDRLGQIAPAVLFVADGYLFNNRAFDRTAEIAQLRAGLPSVRETVWVNYLGTPAPDGTHAYADLLRRDAPPRFTPVPFDHPLYILYSSGTTGVPKGIVHGHGGTLIQHVKEQMLHCDLRRDDVLTYYTTTGWMMWNWLASALATGCTVVLYDGAPFAQPAVLWDIAQAEGVTVFGGSARYYVACEKAGLAPARSHDLSKLRTVLATGSVLPPDGFDYVYRDVKADVCLSSISGGTDIVSCFIAGSPTLPVYRGELQCAGLGMAVAVYDEHGRPVVGERGELVCEKSFPSMPAGFWNDPDGRRYRAAYFERFPGAWCHGDFVTQTTRGGFVIHGRSDAVLNPGGVRIGTAELYREVERHPEVLEAVAVGREQDGDVAVWLFVRLRDGVTLDEALGQRLRAGIRENVSPRHVPARIFAVADIPRTLSGKIAELAVREALHGRPVKNADALANPESLAHFRAAG